MLTVHIILSESCVDIFTQLIHAGSPLRACALVVQICNCTRARVESQLIMQEINKMSIKKERVRLKLSESIKVRQQYGRVQRMSHVRLNINAHARSRVAEVFINKIEHALSPIPTLTSASHSYLEIANCESGVEILHNAVACGGWRLYVRVGGDGGRERSGKFGISHRQFLEKAQRKMRDAFTHMEVGGVDHIVYYSLMQIQVRLTCNPARNHQLIVRIWQRLLQLRVMTKLHVMCVMCECIYGFYLECAVHKLSLFEPARNHQLIVRIGQRLLQLRVGPVGPVHEELLHVKSLHEWRENTN